MAKPKNNLTGADLKYIGFPEGKPIGTALKVAEKYYKNYSVEALTELFNKVFKSPQDFVQHKKLGSIASALILQTKEMEARTEIQLKDEEIPFAVFGRENIEEGAFRQMETAMKLPVSAAGALMPDAHQGYGLPIGGVLAARHAVIPYGVGVDIGCRMCLSIYELSANQWNLHERQLKTALLNNTKFGAGETWTGRSRADHPLLDQKEMRSTPLLRSLLDKAAAQLGTSGGGNHFVEWGWIEIHQDQEGLPKGNYVALLSHSGSRGFGATIAGHYTRLAKELCKLPREAAQLAYLDLNAAEGQEYWLSMTLAGEYASACHHIIHDRITKASGLSLISRVENHHNFAWKEMHQGEELVVHRKGATPAGRGVLGIIPGSMAAPGFLVRGKGDVASINSASHGAGRRMSRTQAMKTFTGSELKKMLEDFGVMLIGGGLDESPPAYKDITEVMRSQEHLVEVIGTFIPKIVRMADDGSKED